MTEKELLNWIKGYCTAVLQAVSDKDDDLFDTTKHIKPISEKIQEFEKNNKENGKQLLTEYGSNWTTTFSALNPTESLDVKEKSEK